jgi:hypothetical protein
MLTFAEVHYDYLNTPRFTMPIGNDIPHARNISQVSRGFQISIFTGYAHSLPSAICVRVCTRGGSYMIDTQRIVGLAIIE